MANPPVEHQFNQDNAAKMGAKGGRNKKGSKHISTIVREFMEDVDWDKVPVKNKEEFKKKYGKNGWVAITAVAAGQAATGDKAAREWLRKAGFGDKVELTGSMDVNVALVEFIGDDDEPDED